MSELTAADIGEASYASKRISTLEQMLVDVVASNVSMRFYGTEAGKVTFCHVCKWEAKRDGSSHINSATTPCWVGKVLEDREVLYRLQRIVRG